MAKGTFSKKNRIIRFAIIFVLALFFFCGKIEINIIKYSSSDPTLISCRIQLFQSVQAQESALPTGGSPLMDLYLEQTANSPGIWERMISGGIILVLGGIQLVCAWLVNIAAYLLNSMLSPNLYNFTSEPIITTGWVAVRDVCNLFFLLILLFIAFCTILQIEKYHAKKTLLIFILMALLVNFSKPIAIFIFDGSQLLMNFFLTKISVASGGDYASKIADISKITNFFGKYNTGFTEGNINSFQLVAKYIFAIIFLFMFGIALLVMALYLLIRIIAIWLLIIVSPFAFLFNAVPDFKKISSDWWDALFKYSYVGPSIAFFLWLSTFITTSSMKSSIEKSSINKGDPLFTSVVEAILPYIVVLVFLYAAIIISQKFGIAFAGAITSRANKALSFFPRKGWQGAKYAARAGLKAGERSVLMPLGLSPRAWKGAWTKRAEERDRQALMLSEAAARDKLNNTLRPGEKSKNYHKDLAQAQLEQEMEKELELIADASLNVSEVRKNRGKKDKISQARMSAAMKQLFKKNDQNDYSIDKMKNGEMEQMTEEDLKQALAADMESTGMSKHQIGKTLNTLGNIAYMQGNIAHHGMGEFNVGSGEFEKTSPLRQLQIIAAKVGTMESQQLAKILHPDSLFIRGADGKLTTEMHNAGKVIFSKMDAAKRKQFDRWRGDLAEATSEAQRQGKLDTIPAVSVPGYNFSPVEIENFKQASKRVNDLYIQDQAVSAPKKPMPAGYENIEYPSDVGFGT